MFNVDLQNNNLLNTKYVLNKKCFSTSKTLLFGILILLLLMSYPIDILSENSELEFDKTSLNVIGESIIEPNTLSVGGEHSCAINVQQELLCWGLNQFNQINSQQSYNISTPSIVEELKNYNVESVELGGNHSCIITIEKQIYCWGLNNLGQTGNSDLQSHNLNQINLPESDWKAMTLGEAHSCAASSTIVMCWGDNSYLQLGGGDINYSITPVQVSLGKDVEIKNIKSSKSTTCALLDIGNLTCWGDYREYHIRDNSQGEELVSRNITSLNLHPYLTTTSFAVMEDSVCYIGDEEIAICSNYYFQNLKPNLKIGEIYAGGETYCIHLSDLSIKCWGKISEQIESVINSRDVQIISIWQDNFCVIFSAGEMACHGKNQFGQIGDGGGGFHGSPTLITLPNGLNASKVVANDYYSCAIMEDASISCWGGEMNPQSAKIAAFSSSPVNIDSNPDNFDIDSKNGVTCAVNLSSEVQCWGYGEHTEHSFGVDHYQENPRTVKYLNSDEIVSIHRGFETTCAMLKNNTAHCWGYDVAGYFELPDYGDSPGKGHMGYQKGQWLEIKTSGTIGCGTNMTNSLSCWGVYSYNGMEYSTRYATDYYFPSDIIWTNNVTDFDIGKGMLCTVNNDIELNCMGQFTNEYKAHISLDLILSKTFDSPIIDLSISSAFACLATESGEIWCWGENSFGQLGDGTINNNMNPQKINMPFDFAVQQINVGGNHACATSIDGQIICWGDNRYGQIGDGTIDLYKSTNYFSGNDWLFSNKDVDYDFIMDVFDKCVSQDYQSVVNENDADSDGCRDKSEDSDDDNDGVEDKFDDCQSTELGAIVDSYGCSESQSSIIEVQNLSSVVVLSIIFFTLAYYFIKK